MVLRKCLGCGLEANTEGDLEKFKASKTAKFGRENRCKECTAAKTRQWYKDNEDRARESKRAYARENVQANRDRANAWQRANRDKARETLKAWKKNNPEKVNSDTRRRRARKRGLPFEDYTRAEIFHRDQGVCHMCLGTCTLDGFEVDHLVPMSIDVENHPGDVRINVMVAHPLCNQVKNNKWADWELVDQLRAFYAGSGRIDGQLRDLGGCSVPV